MPRFPTVPLYLFYGNQVHEMLRAKDDLLGQLLGENRSEGLTEFVPISNRYGTELTKILPELSSELSTLSLISDEKKVAVVTNPTEIYASDSRSSARAAKKPKKTSKGAEAAKAPGPPMYLRWFEEALPETGNTVILLAFEDESDAKEVNEKHPIFGLVARTGYHQRFRDNKAFFRIEDTLVHRNATGCLKAIADLWKTGKGDMVVYNGVVRTLRYLLQANIARDRRIADDPAKMQLFFPASPSLSLQKASDFVRRKYVTGQPPYRTADLVKAYERLIEVYRALRPRSTDVYVADARLILEQILIELFASSQK